MNKIPKLQQPSPTIAIITPPVISTAKENYSSTAKQRSPKTTDQTASEAKPANAMVRYPTRSEEPALTEAINASTSKTTQPTIIDLDITLPTLGIASKPLQQVATPSKHTAPIQDKSSGAAKRKASSPIHSDQTSRLNQT